MSAKIVFCGHSAIIITTEKGKRIAIDPWLDGNPSCPPGLYDPGPIDYIVLSHGHSDHTGSALTLALKTKAVVFATFELGTLLIKDGLPADQYRPMNKGGSVKATDELTISLTQAFHSSSYDSVDGKTYYAGEPCGVVVRLESGKTIYHAGDTSLFSDMTLIAKKFKPSVALLPIGDCFTMDPEDAADAAAMIGADFVIPLHYATFGLLTGTAEQFQEQLAAKAVKSKCVVLDPGQDFEF